MTLYHFGNCVALAYLPYYFVYKYSSLSEYGAFWKCIQAGVIYATTQLFKMLVLATFFPDTNVSGTGAFDLIGEFLKHSVDLFDLIGLYLVLYGIPGRGHIKVLTAGLGWAGAEILLTRFLLLWVGARGAEFDWKYIQKCLESNMNVINHITLSTLVWLWSRFDSKKNYSQTIMGVLLSTSYKSFIIDLIVYWFKLDHVMGLLLKAGAIISYGLVTLRLYIQIQDNISDDTGWYLLERSRPKCTDEARNTHIRARGDEPGDDESLNESTSSRLRLRKEGDWFHSVELLGNKLKP